MSFLLPVFFFLFCLSTRCLNVMGLKKKRIEEAPLWEKPFLTLVRALSHIGTNFET